MMGGMLFVLRGVLWVRVEGHRWDGGGGRGGSRWLVVGSRVIDRGKIVGLIE